MHGEQEKKKTVLCAQLKLSHNLVWCFCVVSTCTTLSNRVTKHAPLHVDPRSPHVQV